MRKCKNKISGEVCEYFVFGVDVIPDWCSKDSLVSYGYYINDNCGDLRVFYTTSEFNSFYEDVSELEDISTYTGVESHPANEVDGMPYVDSGGVPSQYCDVNRCGECTSKKLPDDTVFEYIIYNINSKWYPDWFPNKLKDHFIEHFNLKDGDLFVNPKGMMRYSNNFTENRFNELFEITKPYVPYLYDVCDDTVCIHVSQPPANTGICKSKSSGTEYEYFIVGSGEEPYWFKSVNRERIEEFEDYADIPLYAINIERIYLYEKDQFFGSYDIVSENGVGSPPAAPSLHNSLEGPRFCRLIDSNILHEYFVLGLDTVPEWSKDEKKIRLDRYVKGTNIVRSNEKNNFDFPFFMNDIVCIGNEEFDNCFKVVTDVDASFVSDTFDHVGKKCITSDGLHTYNYFIYGEDKTPDWFDIYRVSHIERMFIDSGRYIVNSFFNDNHPYAILHKIHFDMWYVPLTDAHAEYGSIIREKTEDTYTVKRPIDSGAYLSAEDVAAARFCRCRNDHSVVHEYFVYGTDVTPEWFKGTDFSKGTYIVKRGDNGSVFVMDQHDFIKNLEVVDKLVLTDMYGKKNENYIGKVSEEEMESVSVNYLCTDDGYTVKIDAAAKYATDRMINSIANDASKRPEKMVVNDGVVAAGTKVHTDNWQERIR